MTHANWLRNGSLFAGVGQTAAQDMVECVGQDRAGCGWNDVVEGWVLTLLSSLCNFSQSLDIVCAF